MKYTYSARLEDAKPVCSRLPRDISETFYAVFPEAGGLAPRLQSRLSLISNLLYFILEEPRHSECYM